MFGCIRHNRPCVPEWWLRFILGHSLFVVIAMIVATAGILVYSVINFRIDTDLTDMVSNKLPFRKVYKDYRSAFPQISDVIVVVISADTPEHAWLAQKQLANRLTKQDRLFKSIFLPGGGPFFDKNGLLYLSTDELEDLADKLAEMQPFFATLVRKPSLSGLFSILEQILKMPPESVDDNKSLLRLLDQLNEAAGSVEKGQNHHVSWQEVMFDKTKENQYRRFLITEPYLDYSLLYPARNAIRTIRSTAADLHFTPENDVVIGVTGEVVLNYEDLVSVEKDIGTSAILSLVLVAIVLFVGLRSGRLIFSSLLTLVCGLILTLGFAIFFIGHLNMISVTFAVLFIGLGVDYSIQFCLRYSDLVIAGHDNRHSLSTAATQVGNALILCTLTTAIGFYAFVPTAYVGASELGLIAGTGMFINLFANLTLLPAVLNLTGLRSSGRKTPPIGQIFESFTNHYSRRICAVAIVLAGVSAMLLPQVSFDSNPLNLSSRQAESLQILEELFQDWKTSPWTMSILSDDLKAASALASRLNALDSVKKAVTIAEFVPANQSEKRALISDMALFIPNDVNHIVFATEDDSETVAALKDFESELAAAVEKNPGTNETGTLLPVNLLARMQRLNALIENPATRHAVLNHLRESFLPTLKILLEQIGTWVHPEEFDLSQLPEDLKRRYVSEDGRYRLEVFPEDNLSDIRALRRFVTEVQSIAPEATAAPVTILESGKAIVTAFRLALVMALAAIAVLLLFLLRNLIDVVLILTPLVVAILYTSATTVVLHIPFNFANIIVVPLLLGTGVDYGIHLIHCFRTDLSPDKGLLETSTSRAVFFSALTTIVSFGTLAVIPHQGTASMGILLMLCLGFIIVCSLILLPAVLRVLQIYGHGRRYERPLDSQD